MAKHFTETEIENLRKNPYVEKVSVSTITYTQEFRELYISEYRKGKMPTQIISDAGFDSKILGKLRIDSIARRFKEMAIRVDGFADTRKGKSGRPSTRELTAEEQLERLKHKVKYLEQENEFLKKIEFLNRQAEWKENGSNPRRRVQTHPRNDTT